jgi:hypothetical protein
MIHFLPREPLKYRVGSGRPPQSLLDHRKHALMTGSMHSTRQYTLMIRVPLAFLPPINVDSILLGQ